MERGERECFPQASKVDKVNSLSLMPNYQKLPLRGRKEIINNSELRSVLLAHGKRPIELYDDL